MAPGEANLWSSVGQLVLVWWPSSGALIWTGLVWPCGLNAGVFAGLKPIFQSAFSLKGIQSQHHSVMQTKMWEVGAIREFSTKACSDLN